MDMLNHSENRKWVPIPKGYTNPTPHVEGSGNRHETSTNGGIRLLDVHDEGAYNLVRWTPAWRSAGLSPFYIVHLG